jgi:hypothetical protein
MKQGNSCGISGGCSLGFILIINLLVAVLIKVSVSFTAFDDAKGFRMAADLLNQGSYLEAMGAYHEIVTHSEVYENRAKGLFFMGTILQPIFGSIRRGTTTLQAPETGLRKEQLCTRCPF